MKPDYAHKETDKIIDNLSKDIKREYSKASKEVEAKLNDYWRRFETKDNTWRKWVKEGKKSRKDYIEWRQGQMIAGKRWDGLKNKLAEEYRNADRIARNIITGGQAQAYVLNAGYGTYNIEKALRINTSFSMYDRKTVERILLKNPDLLPKPGKNVKKDIREGKAVLWNKRQVQSAAMQGILQGESSRYFW